VFLLVHPKPDSTNIRIKEDASAYFSQRLQQSVMQLMLVQTATIYDNAYGHTVVNKSKQWLI